MIARRLLCLVALMAALLGLGQAALPTAAPAQRAPAPSFVYAYLGGGTPRIFAFRLDRNCTLAPLPGSPFPINSDRFIILVPGEAQALSYSSRRQLLFNGGSGGLRAWRIGVNGSLAPAPGTPVDPNLFLLGVRVVELGSRTFVYSTEPIRSLLYGYEVLPNQLLVPVPGSPFATGGIGPLGINSVGNCLFVVNGDSTSVASYQVQANGFLVAAPGSPFTPAGSFPFFEKVYVSPGSRRLFLPDISEGSLIFGLGADPATCALFNTPGSPFASGRPNVLNVAVGKSLAFGLALPLDPMDRLDIQAFRNAPDGTLTPLGPLQSSGSPSGLDGGVLSPSGDCLVATSPFPTGEIRAFFVNRNTGQVTVASTQPMPTEENTFLQGIVIR